MEDLFYRDFSAQAPVETGTRHLEAAAARLLLSAEMGLARIPGEVGERLRALLNAQNLIAFAVIMAAWAAATIAGGPLGVAVDGILLGIGAFALARDVISVAGGVKDWVVTAYQAEDEAGLVKASVFFAEAAAQLGVSAVEYALSTAAFSKARALIVERFPAARFFKFRKKEAGRPEPAKEGEPGRSEPAEPPRAERRPIEEKVGDVARGAGGAEAASAVGPILAVVAAGGMAAAALLLLLLASRKPVKGGRR